MLPAATRVGRAPSSRCADERGRRRLAVRAGDGDVALLAAESAAPISISLTIGDAGVARRRERRRVGRHARDWRRRATLARCASRSCAAELARRRRSGRSASAAARAPSPLPASRRVDRCARAREQLARRRGRCAPARPRRSRRRSQSAGIASISEVGPACSAQLERAEREERAQDADDPEAHHDLRLAPSLHLEVMVQRRSQKDAMRLRVLEAVAAAAGT